MLHENPGVYVVLTDAPIPDRGGKAALRQVESSGTARQVREDKNRNHSENMFATPSRN
jgi:hypothetical protein